MLGTFRSSSLDVGGDVGMFSTAGFGLLRTTLMMENEDAVYVIVVNNKRVRKPPPHFAIAKMLLLLLNIITWRCRPIALLHRYPI